MMDGRNDLKSFERGQMNSFDAQTNIYCVVSEKKCALSTDTQKGT